LSFALNLIGLCPIDPKMLVWGFKVVPNRVVPIGLCPIYPKNHIWGCRVVPNRVVSSFPQNACLGVV
jgi:hypothetical protein